MKGGRKQGEKNVRQPWARKSWLKSSRKWVEWVEWNMIPVKDSISLRPKFSFLERWYVHLCRQNSFCTNLGIHGTWPNIFTSLGPQNPPIDEFYVVQKLRSADFETLNRDMVKRRETVKVSDLEWQMNFKVLAAWWKLFPVESENMVICRPRKKIYFHSRYDFSGDTPGQAREGERDLDSLVSQFF